MNAGRESLVEYRDPFAQMRTTQERVDRIRGQLSLPGDVKVSGFDIKWLCGCLERVLGVMQDGETAWGYVDTTVDPPSAGPMMVLRHALAEALGG